jgi:hypothetical protein
VSVDNNSLDPTGRVYRLSATEDGLFNGVGGNSVQYFAYADVGAAGVKTMGMTAPGSQKWVLAGVEVQATVSASQQPVSVYAGPPATRWRTEPPTGRWVAAAAGQRWKVGAPHA